MFRSLIACLLLCATSLAAEEPGRDEMIQELVSKLKKVVPEGWKVGINQLRAGHWDYTYHPGNIHIEVWREERAAFHEPSGGPNPYDPVPGRPESSSSTKEINPFDPTGELGLGTANDAEDDALAAALGGPAQNQEKDEADQPKPADPPADHGSGDGLEAALALTGGKSYTKEELMEGMTPKQRERFLDEWEGRLHPHYSFNLSSYISPEEHARREAMDDEVLRKWKEFAKALNHIPAPGWGRGCLEPHNYDPETTDDKKLVQAFDDYIEANPRISTYQDCYYKTLSFGFWDQQDHQRPKSEEVYTECSGVLAKIRTVITFYKGKEPRR